MKTRLRFKIIAVLICLSLVGLLISQGYWLKGLYVSSKKSTWDNKRMPCGWPTIWNCSCAWTL